MAVMLRSGGLAVPVYAATLALTLVATAGDDAISLYSVNATWYQGSSVQMVIDWSYLVTK